MTFNKSISLLFIIFLSSSCGVKGDPVPPKDTILPSIESHYINGDKNKVEKAMKKEDEEKKEQKK